jgi:hypothetical protein
MNDNNQIIPLILTLNDDARYTVPKLDEFKLFSF